MPGDTVESLVPHKLLIVPLFSKNRYILPPLNPVAIMEEQAALYYGSFSLACVCVYVLVCHAEETCATIASRVRKNLRSETRYSRCDSG